MSSGPVGLDVKEYAYAITRYTVPDDVEHILDAGKRWLVTRIQFFAPVIFPPPGNGYIIVPGGQIFVEPGGCAELEPNGAMRERMLVFGEGAILIVEWWYQPLPDGTIPPVVIT